MPIVSHQSLYIRQTCLCGLPVNNDFCCHCPMRNNIGERVGSMADLATVILLYLGPHGASIVFLVKIMDFRQGADEMIDVQCQWKYLVLC